MGGENVTMVMITNEQLVLNVAILTTLMVQDLLFIAHGNLIFKKHKFLCLITKGVHCHCIDQQQNWTETVGAYHAQFCYQ